MNGSSLFKAVLVATIGLSCTAYAEKVKVGSIEIEHAYTRATVPGQKVGGGFMKIENKGAADTLVSATSPISGEVQLHEMTMDGNVMKMRQVKNIVLPAGGTIELKPGGLHIMFMNIQTPLKAGESVPVKLKFAKAGDVEVKMPVDAMGAKRSQSSQHGGMVKH